jgi:hypothetical protein
MAAVDDVDRLSEQYHLALDEFLKGNPEPAEKLWSHREDVSLANPYGPPVRGWGRLLRRWSMPHRYGGMAGPLAGDKAKAGWALIVQTSAGSRA